MIHGWNTEKTAESFIWRVYSFQRGIGQVTLQSGICTTRAKAMGQAKKWVLFYRRTARAEAA